MNNNLKRLIEPGTRLFFFFLVIFAITAYFFEPLLAFIEAGVVVLLFVYSVIANRRRQKKFAEYIESVTYDVETAKNDSLVNFPLPMVAFKLENGSIVWGNRFFFELFGSRTPRFDTRLTDLVPEFKSKWLLEGKQQYPELVEIDDRSYRVFGNIIRGENENSSDFMGMTYWLDVTDYERTKEEYENSRPVVAIIIFDNLDEISRNQSDRVKTELQNMVSDRIDRWCSGMNGIICRYDREEYIAAKCMFSNGYTLRQYSDKYGSGEYVEYEMKFYSEQTNPAVYTPGVKWDGAGSDKLADLFQMIRMLTTKGNAATEVLLGSDAADEFLGDAKLKELLDLNNYRIGQIDPIELPQGAARLGRINVRGHMIDLLTYDGTYEDEVTGVITPFIPAKQICVTAPGAGRGLYGAVSQIEQADGQFHTYMGRRVPRYWAEKSAREIIVSARPLFIPKTKDPFITATVLD